MDSSNFVLAIGILFLTALALAIYFAPSMVADARYHHNAMAIFFCNLFFGWSIIGWAIALVWALTESRDSQLEGVEQSIYRSTRFAFNEIPFLLLGFGFCGYMTYQIAILQGNRYGYFFLIGIPGIFVAFSQHFLAKREAVKIKAQLSDLEAEKGSQLDLFQQKLINAERGIREIDQTITEIDRSFSQADAARRRKLVDQRALYVELVDECKKAIAIIK